MIYAHSAPFLGERAHLCRAKFTLWVDVHCICPLNMVWKFLIFNLSEENVVNAFLKNRAARRADFRRHLFVGNPQSGSSKVGKICDISKPFSAILACPKNYKASCKNSGPPNLNSDASNLNEMRRSFRGLRMWFCGVGKGAEILRFSSENQTKRAVSKPIGIKTKTN